MSSNLNLTQIPEIIGSVLNLDTTVSGVLISVGITIIAIICLGLLVDNYFSELPIVSTVIGLFTLFTFLGWFPIFPFILIALVVAILYGRQAVKYMSGGGGN